MKGLEKLKKLRESGLAANASDEKILMLEVALIDPDPENVRKPEKLSIGNPKMQELMASIKIHGVLQHISVRENPEQPGRYLTNFGARRLVAARALGHLTIKAVIKESVDKFARMVENLQREDTTLREDAEFVHHCLTVDGISNTEIAERLGKDLPWVSRHIGLLDHPFIANLIDTDVLANAEAAQSIKAIYVQDAEFIEQKITSLQAEGVNSISQARARRIRKEFETYKTPQVSPVPEKSVQREEQEAGKFIQPEEASPAAAPSKPVDVISHQEAISAFLGGSSADLSGQPEKQELVETGVNRTISKVDPDSLPTSQDSSPAPLAAEQLIAKEETEANRKALAEVLQHHQDVNSQVQLDCFKQLIEVAKNHHNSPPGNLAKRILLSCEYPERYALNLAAFAKREVVAVIFAELIDSLGKSETIVKPSEIDPAYIDELDRQLSLDVE